MTAGVSRRGFLASGAATAGSLVIGLHIPSAGAQAAQADEINAWVVIKPDDTVVVRIARSEMGQGTLTGLAQLLAEELECDWARVSTEYPTPGQNLARQRVWGSMSTTGSRGLRESQLSMREGGAKARMMLVQAAAQRFGVPADECVALNSRVSHAASGRSASFGQLAAAAAQLPLPTAVVLKDPKTWRLAGKPARRLDTAAKLNGAQVFSMDLKLPGMLNAAIKSSPVIGGKLKSFDATAVLKRPGVKTVLRVSDSAVAVVADTWWRAKTALDSLPLVWDEGEHAQLGSAGIAAMLKEGLDAPDAVVGTSRGDAKGALSSAGRVVEAVYSYPFQHHATMETMNATARWTPERCEVWTGTQNGESTLSAAAQAAGLPPAQCEVYKLHLGGGFGRRGAVQDWVRQAVTIAKAFPGTPVKLIWSREEDMRQGCLHPITQCKLRGALDDAGHLSALHLRISGQSILAGLFPGEVKDGTDPRMFQGLHADSADGHLGYRIPNLLIDAAMRNTPVRPGFWRGVNLNQNAIYAECFIDELAHAAGKDPLVFRRTLMAEHPKHLAVLNAVAARAGWGQTLPRNHHLGVAQFMGYGSYVAACAEVSVTQGKLKIHRIVAATDPGHVVNPQLVEAQVEGSFAFGLSAVLFGACTVQNGRIEQDNFGSYPMVQMAHMPPVETLVMPSGGFWGGVGEPTIAVAGPAVLNAIFAATGVRIRELP